MRDTIKAVLLGAALVSGVLSAASATVLTVNLNDVVSNDGFGASGNVVNNYNIGAFSEVVGLSYNVSIDTFGPSYLSEPEIIFTDSAVTQGVIFKPGYQDQFSGQNSYIGSLDLPLNGLTFHVGADGILRIEFAESYNDQPGADAFLNGTLNFTYNRTGPAPAVPEPATWAMMLGGFGLVGGALRSRNKVAVRFA